MAKQCEVCSRTPKAGQSRSHSNIITKRRILPNLQKTAINGQKQILCTSCLKTAKKKHKASK